MKIAIVFLIYFSSVLLLPVIPPNFSNNTVIEKILSSVDSFHSAIIHIYKPDTTTNFANPERGWFYTIDPNYATNVTAPGLTLKHLNNLHKAYNITLIRKYYLLYDYVNSDSIAASYITKQLQNDLDVCRSAGFKLIPRFTYNNNIKFTAKANRDATLAITKAHIYQLMEVLNKNIDVVDHLHAGFVGLWAEWHDSYQKHVADYSLHINESGLSIINTLFATFSSKRMIAFRYPHFFNQLYNFKPLDSAMWYQENMQARMGFHNDGFAYDSTDFGTYNQQPDTMAILQRNFLKAQSQYVVVSGEPAGGTPYTGEHIVYELKSYHFSSLSMNMPDAAVFYKAIKAAGKYDSISMYLGYRYSLVKAAIPGKARVGGALLFSYTIHNSGWASTHNKRNVNLILRNTATGKVYQRRLISDPRYWFAGQTISLNCQVKLSGIPAGTYSLLLNLNDPEPLLSKRAAYSIRLANKELWEPATGYNSLQHTLLIK